MCNLSEGIWEEAYKEGRIIARLETLHAVMNSCGWTMEEAMVKLGFSEEKKRETYELMDLYCC